MLFFLTLGGPVVSFDNTENRFFLLGTIHGAFEECQNRLPGIYVEADDLSILTFLHKEVFGSGMF